MKPAIPTTTPMGWRTQNPSSPSPLGSRSRGTVSPWRRATSSAAVVRVNRVRSTSTRQSTSGLPVSRTRSCSNSARRSATAAMRLHQRSATDVRREGTRQLTQPSGIRDGLCGNLARTDGRLGDELTAEREADHRRRGRGAPSLRRSAGLRGVPMRVDSVMMPPPTRSAVPPPRRARRMLGAAPQQALRVGVLRRLVDLLRRAQSRRSRRRT